MKIQFANPKLNYLTKREEILSSIKKVLNKGDYILGEQVDLFEKEFLSFLGNKGHFVSCASGTDAITLALIANGIKPGSRVIVPSHTATASIASILNADCEPLFIDINEKSLLLSIRELKKLAKLKKVKAAVAVHLYGSGVDIIELKKVLRGNEIKIIEDCAQSVGTFIRGKHSGTLGDSGCFSFFPTKNLGTLGDGGGVWVPNLTLKNKLISLRQYGWNKKREVILESGINSRLDEIQAAILRIKLKYLSEDINRRRDLAKRYDRYLKSDFQIINQPGHQKSSFHLYIVKHKKRDDLIKYMKAEGINLGIHYYPANHKNGVYKKYSRGFLKNTENASREVVSLPIFPELKNSEQDLIIKKLNDFD